MFACWSHVIKGATELFVDVTLTHLKKVLQKERLVKFHFDRTSSKESFQVQCLMNAQE